MLLQMQMCSSRDLWPEGSLPVTITGRPRGVALNAREMEILLCLFPCFFHWQFAATTKSFLSCLYLKLLIIILICSHFFSRTNYKMRVTTLTMP
ncbi:hypothetical protein CRYUN_Cryun02cG0199500 [Craigia yunnanensis]